MRLRARNAYLIGSESLLSSAVAEDLRAAGVANVGRIAAVDRFALGPEIARDILSYETVEDFDEVILALGEAPEENRAWRYATSAAVAAAAADAGQDGDAVWLATGRNYPDALAAGPAAAALGAPLLLVDGSDPAGSPESTGYLEDTGVRSLVVVGGPSAITDDVAAFAASP